MGSIAYSFFAYALTAVISYAVVGVIVSIDRVMSRRTIDANGKES